MHQYALHTKIVRAQIADQDPILLEIEIFAVHFQGFESLHYNRYARNFAAILFLNVRDMSYRQTG